MTTHRLRHGIGTLFAAGALGALAHTPALAQQAEEDILDLGRVEITGSRVHRAAVEGPLPVAVISRAELDAAGDVSVAEFLGRQPFNTFGEFVPESGLGGGQQAQALLGLRGLGAQRTLVLIDGRRMANTPAFAGTVQNLNTLPLAMIERIEVLREGASAIYGSDAIGGVVNVITRRDFEGLQLSGQIERPSGNGGDGTHASLVAGISSPRGNLTFGFEHFERDILMRRDRDYLYNQEPSLIGGPGTFYRVDDRNDPMHEELLGPEGQLLQAFPNCPDAFDGADHPSSARLNLPFFTAGDTFCEYRFTDVAGQTASVRRDSLTLTGDVRLSDSLTGFTRVSASRLGSFSRFAAAPVTPLFGGLSMGRDNPNNPTIGELTDGDGNPVGHDLFLIFRPVAAGPRDDHVRDQVTEALFGLRGELNVAGFTDWEVAGFHNRYAQNGNGYNYGLAPALQELVDDGTLNPFDPDPDSFAPFLHTVTSDNEYRSRGFDARVGFGDVWGTGPFALPLVLGGEFRDERYASLVDQQTEAGNVFGNAGSSATGSRNFYAVYAESTVLLADDRVELGLALRHDDYSDFGSRQSPKLSLGVRPLDTLLLRASYGHGFRAPDLEILNRQPSEVFPPGLQDRLGCELNPDSAIACSSQQYSTLATSNPDLNPERSRNFNVGAVFSPMQDVSLSLDWYRIRLRDGIGNLTAQNVLDNDLRCHQQGRPCDPAQEGTVIRTGPVEDGGVVTRIIAPAANFTRELTDGFDLQADYGLDTGLGRFGVGLNGTWVNSYRRSTAPDSPLEEVTRSVASPKWRAVSRLSWSHLDFDGELRVNHVPATRDCSVAKRNSDSPGDIEDCQRRMGSFTTLDLQGGWDTPWDGRLVIGARNVLDRDPPLSEEIGVVGFPEPAMGVHDLLGRVPYVRYTQRF